MNEEVPHRTLKGKDDKSFEDQTQLWFLESWLTGGKWRERAFDTHFRTKCPSVHSCSLAPLLTCKKTRGGIRESNTFLESYVASKSQS